MNDSPALLRNTCLKNCASESLLPGARPKGGGMVRIFKLGFVLVVMALGGVTSLADTALKAGAAKVDITPPPGLPMWGYSARLSASTGTLDPLYARVLVVESGEKRLALVTLDLGRTFGPDSLAHLRESVRKSSGISYVLVAASHTHSGPAILDEYPSNATPTWESLALEKIAKAIDEAHQNVAEAHVGFGYGITYIGHNRRRLNPDGSVTMFWRNPTKLPTSPFDATVSVLRVDTASRRPLAILVNHACHPVVFGPDNVQYSADFPGAMTRKVEQILGGQMLCFFLQGAAGDIDPFYDGTPLEQDAIKMRDWTGEHLGEEAARVAQAIRTERESPSDLEFAQDSLVLQLRWEPEEFRRALLSYGQTFYDSFAPRIRQSWELPVATVLINKHIAMMSMPGEPFIEFQMNWRDRCPVPDTFFLGYANGYYGYFPTVRAASEGGYGAAGATTWVEVGAGERMVEHALVKTYEMLGRLSDVPEDLKK
jgi:neutral ceramidase